MFKDLFNDENKINEKSVAGFIALSAMVITLLADISMSVAGKTLNIHQYIFDGFLILTLGSLGIASIDKWINNRK